MIRIWLLFQLTGLAAAPFSLCCSQLADQTPECCKGLAPGATCPMHHGDDDDSTCKMRSACSRSDAALLALTGGLGVLPAPTIGVIAFDRGVAITAAAASTVLRSDRPDPPPPRA